VTRQEIMGMGFATQLHVAKVMEISSDIMLPHRD